MKVSIPNFGIAGHRDFNHLKTARCSCCILRGQGRERIVDVVQGGTELEPRVNPLNAELNPICYLLPLLAHHFLHVSRIRVKSLTLRLLMSYTYMEHLFLMFLDHTQRRSTVGRTPLDE